MNKIKELAITIKLKKLDEIKKLDPSIHPNINTILSSYIGNETPITIRKDINKKKKK